MKISQAHEDYLEAIVELAGILNNPVRSVDLALKLGVSKPSVNKAVGVLRELGLVSQEPYGDIVLTEAGVEYGASVLARHNMLYGFLTDVLGVSPQTAELEACQMEHAISDDTLDRWVRYLCKHHSGEHA